MATPTLRASNRQGSAHSKEQVVETFDSSPAYGYARLWVRQVQLGDDAGAEMAVKRWMGVVAGLVVLAAVGCGDDNGASEGNQASNQNHQAPNESPNQGDPSNQGGPADQEVSSEDVDRWVGSTLDNEGSRTAVEPGQSLGGRFGRDGSHFFELDLEAGALLSIEKVAVDPALEEALEDMEWSFRQRSPEGDHDLVDITAVRHFKPAKSEARQFFVPYAGAYELRVDAPGDEEEAYGFHFELQEVNLDEGASTFEVGEHLDGLTMDGADLGQWKWAVDESKSVEMELLAQALESASDARGWLYLWDLDRGELVSESNRRAGGGDARMVVGLEEGQYQWVVDMVGHPQGAEYALASRQLATSEGNPKRLSLGQESSFEGVIEAPGAEAYSDYFEVVLEPGQQKKLSVQGLDALSPSLLVVAREGAGAVTGIAEAVLPDGQHAGAMLALSDEASESVRLLIELSDVVNFQGSLGGDAVGGDEYDYQLTLEMADPQSAVVDGADEPMPSLETGEALMVTATVASDELLGLFSDVEPQPMGTPAAETGFVPTWLNADGWSLSPLGQLAGYWQRQRALVRGDGSEVRMWLRDRYFRQGPSQGLEVTALRFSDQTPPSTTPVASGEASIDDAPMLAAGERIGGAFDDLSPGTTRFFELDALAAPSAVAIVDRGANPDLEMRVVDGDNEEVEWPAPIQEMAPGPGQPVSDQEAMLVSTAGSGPRYLRLSLGGCSAAPCDDAPLEVDLLAP